MREKRLPIEEGRKSAVSRDYETKRIDEVSSAADGGRQVSEFLEMISSKRRRYVLYALQSEKKATFGEVSDRVAIWETETPLEELDERTRQNIRVDLHHTHLPKLEDAGIIRYDRQSGVVHLRDLSDATENVLDYYRDIERPG
jgi:DNA-binding transcriptional ArsR family regulator